MKKIVLLLKTLFFFIHKKTAWHFHQTIYSQQGLENFGRRRVRWIEINSQSRHPMDIGCF